MVLMMVFYSHSLKVSSLLTFAELAQLGNPPTAENVTCANATVVWSGWQKGIDRGDQNVPIAQYE